LAQGCILPFTDRDNAALRASLRDPLARSAFRATDAATEQQDLGRLHRAASYPLSDPSHPAHDLFVGHVLRNVAGNESISDDFKSALPAAILEISRQSPVVSGLVRKSRGRGASAQDKTLKNPRTGNGFAYELLGTAELIRRNRIHSSGSHPVNEGAPRLQIFTGDNIDLGFRFQAGYGAAGKGLGLDRPTATRGGKGFRHTFEADLLITRTDSMIGDWHTVGVDFKHVGKPGAEVKFDQDSVGQLEGISNAILTGDMNLDSFHFVSNSVFSVDFKEAVKTANQRIIERSDGDITRPLIGLHENMNALRA
jgi:hypothetical protein